MRVLVLSYFYPPEIGAPGFRLRAVTDAFLRRGWSVDVVTGMPQYPLGRVFRGYRGWTWRRETVDGACVYRVPTYATHRLGVHRLASYGVYALGATLLGIVLRRPWDVVFVESPPLFTGLPGLWLAARARARLALDVTDIWPDSARELRLVRSERLLGWAERLERALYGRAWRISCATNGIAERLRAGKGVPAEKLDPLPNGVDPAVFAPRAPDPDWPGRLGLDGRRIFAYAGLHGHAQGLHVLLQSARLLQTDRDVGFLLIGDGPAKVDLVTTAARDGLDNVRFLAAVPAEEAGPLLAQSYASVVPLLAAPVLKGAVPSKIITSLSAGVPVVFCGEGEAAELLRSRRCGVVTEPENPVKLAEVIRWLSAHPEERDALGRNGLALARRQYRWEELTECWLDRWGLG